LQAIQWTNEFAVGVEEIDEQHRALVGMIIALDARTHCDPSPETTRSLLTQLNDYVRDHFALEERLMGGGGCTPELVARHFGEHAYFRSVLKDLTTDFEMGRRDITIPLIEHLVHWFLHHIVVVDRTMARQLNSDPQLGARVATALNRDVTDELAESERQLVSELHRANEELERQVQQRTRVLSEVNRKLEIELGEMKAQVERLSAKLPRS
jgi:hemerythrin